MLTPASIRNPTRVSGFDHVGYNVSPGKTAPKPYQAVVYGGKRSKAGMKWIGPRRATSQEAAQDYCDYINTGNGPTPHTNKSAGHKRPQQPQRHVPSDIQAARGMIRDWEAQQKKGVQGFVYCISDGTAVKIGYSVNPAKRVVELQTGNPRVLTLLGTIKGTEATETALHVKYAAENLLQEWFRPTEALLSEFGIVKRKEAA